MPTKNDTPVPAIKFSDDGIFVHYGFEHEGAFHPLTSERIGDYNERIEAAKDEDK